MLRHMGMCCPNGLLFHLKSLIMGPILVKRKSLEEGPISQKLQKLVKSAVSELEKSLEMGPNLRKFKKKTNKKQKQSNQPFFEGEKSLDMGRGFRPQAAHPIKKWFEYPPGVYTCLTTIIFGKQNDRSLIINSLASNICFCYRNFFQNGINTFSKIVDTFLSKAEYFM